MTAQPMSAKPEDEKPAPTTQPTETLADSTAVALADLTAVDSMAVTVADDAALSDLDETEESGGFHKPLKTKFIDGNVGFMSLVALALVLGLAFCIERILYLMMSEIKAKKLMEDIEAKLPTTWRVPRRSAATRGGLWPASAIRDCCTSTSRWMLLSAASRTTVVCRLPIWRKAVRGSSFSSRWRLHWDSWALSLAW